jgi:hypothetical protein
MVCDNLLGGEIMRGGMPPKRRTVAKKPVAKKPVAKKPAAKKPVTKKPVAKKSVKKTVKKTGCSCKM